MNPIGSNLVTEFTASIWEFTWLISRPLEETNWPQELGYDDGDRWELVHVFDAPTPGDGASHRFAYPWLLDSTRGELHLLYTWDRHRIVHVRFNRAWLVRNR